MVENQLIRRGIKNPAVLNAFLNVPRENFVLKKYLMHAYEDHPMPICANQTISQPYMQALMTEIVYKNPPAKALDVGTGSGYQTALLAYLGYDVVSIEKLEEVAKFAENNFSTLPYCSKIKLITGDGTLGCPEEAPFDIIIVSGASPKIPEPLLNQLAPSGKLTIPCGNLEIQTLLLAEKSPDGKKVKITEHCGCRFVPLIGKHAFKDIL